MWVDMRGVDKGGYEVDISLLGDGLESDRKDKIFRGRVVKLAKRRPYQTI